MDAVDLLTAFSLVFSCFAVGLNVYVMLRERR